MGHTRRFNNVTRRRRIQPIEACRIALGAHANISEQMIPISALTKFFGIHERHAKLKLKYPQVVLHRDTVSWGIVDVYRQTFRLQALAGNAYQNIHTAGMTSLEIAEIVARDHSVLVFPKASADANYVAAYAMLKCQSIFATQNFFCSCLSAAQRIHRATGERTLEFGYLEKNLGVLVCAC